MNIPVWPRHISIFIPVAYKYRERHMKCENCLRTEKTAFEIEDSRNYYSVVSNIFTFLEQHARCLPKESAS